MLKIAQKHERKQEKYNWRKPWLGKAAGSWIPCDHTLFFCHRAYVKAAHPGVCVTPIPLPPLTAYLLSWVSLRPIATPSISQFSLPDKMPPRPAVVSASAVLVPSQEAKPLQLLLSHQVHCHDWCGSRKESLYLMVCLIVRC